MIVKLKRLFVGYLSKIIFTIMDWNQLDNAAKLAAIKEESNTQKVLIFKHSTRCSISTMALGRLERSWKDNEMTALKPYYLDLLNFRSISNQIAEDFGITHESPQVLVIENGQCVYHASHSDIDYKELKSLL
jgi:bacillithiol system protein YtxJ